MTSKKGPAHWMSAEITPKRVPVDLFTQLVISSATCPRIFAFYHHLSLAIAARRRLKYCKIQQIKKAISLTDNCVCVLQVGLAFLTNYAKCTHISSNPSFKEPRGKLIRRVAIQLPIGLEEGTGISESLSVEEIYISSKPSKSQGISQCNAKISSMIL